MSATNVYIARSAVYQKTPGVVALFLGRPQLVNNRWVAGDGDSCICLAVANIHDNEPGCMTTQSEGPAAALLRRYPAVRDLANGACMHLALPEEDENDENTD